MRSANLLLSKEHSFGPYKIVPILRNDWYLIKKIGEHGGSYRISTSADRMKTWPSRQDSEFPDSSDEDDQLFVDNDDGSIGDDTEHRMAKCGDKIFSHRLRENRIKKESIKKESRDKMETDSESARVNRN